MFSVIFEVHPGEGRRDAYLEFAKQLKPVLESIDGFIDNERFESRTRPGWVLSHSTWRDEKAVIRWRTQMKHHLVQEKGRSEVFSDYHLRVAQIISDTHPPDGHAVREQRFDATEIAPAKACSLIEVSPRSGVDLPEDTDAVLGGIGLRADAPGLVDHDVFASIYNPGKIAVLASWAQEDAAKAFRPHRPDAAETLRARAVRVIRDYGMYDRRETPQFYPDVERRQ